MEEEIVESLEEHVQENYVGRCGVKDIEIYREDGYIYIDWVKGLTDDKIEETIKILRIILESNDFEKKVDESVTEFYEYLKNNSGGYKHNLCRFNMKDNQKLELELYRSKTDNYLKVGNLSPRPLSVNNCFDVIASVSIREGNK